MKLYGLCKYKTKQRVNGCFNHTLIIKKVSIRKKDLKTTECGEFIEDVTKFCTVKGKYAFYKTNPFKKIIRITGI